MCPSTEPLRTAYRTSPNVQKQGSPGENLARSLLEDPAAPGWHLPTSQLASLILFPFLGLCFTMFQIGLEGARPQTQCNQSKNLQEKQTKKQTQKTRVRDQVVRTDRKGLLKLSLGQVYTLLVHSCPQARLQREILARHTELGDSCDFKGHATVGG